MPGRQEAMLRCQRRQPKEDVLLGQERYVHVGRYFEACVADTESAAVINFKPRAKLQAPEKLRLQALRVCACGGGDFEVWSLVFFGPVENGRSHSLGLVLTRFHFRLVSDET